MAVVMVAGNQTWMPKGLFQGLRTMTSNIVIEMGYAADLHRAALIATGVVLFVFILLLNLCFSHRPALRQLERLCRRPVRIQPYGAHLVHQDQGLGQRNTKLYPLSLIHI